MSLEELISSYGYAAVGIGTFLEGEMVLVIGGFAAHREYLQLPWVILSAFLGTFFGDQLYFYIGRSQGAALLQRKPHWQARADRVFQLLHKHQIWLILGFRFLYGLRTLTPFLIGASRISPTRFLFLNMVGAALWAVIIGCAGYVFGYALTVLIGDIKRFELLVFAGLIIAGFLLWFFYRVRKPPTGKD